MYIFRQSHGVEFLEILVHGHWSLLQQTMCDADRMDDFMQQDRILLCSRAARHFEVCRVDEYEAFRAMPGAREIVVSEPVRKRIGSSESVPILDVRRHQGWWEKYFLRPEFSVKSA